jgi:hypothetical protein
MATSRIPALKEALRDRLQALTGASQPLEGVQVTYGPPAAEEPARELVMLLNTRPVDPTGGRPGGQSSAAMGFQRREERFVLEVDVRVLKPETQEIVTERAFAIAAAIEDSVRSWGTTNPAFGGVVRWALVTSVWHEEGVRTSEREAVVHVDIACAERI